MLIENSPRNAVTKTSREESREQDILTHANKCFTITGSSLNEKANRILH